ncbi:hypothetical protein BH23VER1_BH23VER1_35180 [soil metagenome]
MADAPGPPRNCSSGEDYPQWARETRADHVEPKRPSPSPRTKAVRKKPAEGAPVHSFRPLLKDLATLTRNTIS